MKKTTLIAAISMVILSACGNGSDLPRNDPEGQEQQKQPTKQQCEAGYFGSDCQPCTCKNGTCNEGLEGDGHCAECEAGFYGIDCNSAVLECINGTSSEGIDGNGTCTCNDNWDGLKCDKCKAGFYGANCSKAVDCQNGKANDGINGDGHCSKCDAGFYGTDCDSKNDCQHGTANEGIDGDGKCTKCDKGYYGPNCEYHTNCVHGKSIDGFTGSDTCSECDEGWFGLYCNQKVTCKNGTPSDGIGGNGKCIGQCHNGALGENCDTCDDNHYGKRCDKEYGMAVGKYDNGWPTRKTVIINGKEWLAEDSNNWLPQEGSGWRAPSEEDLQDMVEYVRKHMSADSVIAALSKAEDWPGLGTIGRNEFGFNMKPNNYECTTIKELGTGGQCWSFMSPNDMWHDDTGCCSHMAIVGIGVFQTGGFDGLEEEFNNFSELSPVKNFNSTVRYVKDI